VQIGAKSFGRNAGSGFVSGYFVAVGSRGLFVFVQDVGELGRIEDLAAELAHNELGVLLAGDDANLGMFARCGHKGEKQRVGKKFAFAQTACQS
jgi:hypothetical protein